MDWIYTQTKANVHDSPGCVVHKCVECRYALSSTTALSFHNCFSVRIRNKISCALEYEKNVRLLRFRKPPIQIQLFRLIRQMAPH